jgi:hypothetical protein
MTHGAALSLPNRSNFGRGVTDVTREAVHARIRPHQMNIGTRRPGPKARLWGPRDACEDERAGSVRR